MPQFARPSADITNQGYVNQVGAASNLWQSINDASPNDATFIRSPNNPEAAVYVTKLTPTDDPGVSSDHIIRIRGLKDLTNPATVVVGIQLRQDYVNESSQGTLIADREISDLTSSATTYPFELTGPEADDITDYTELYIRIETSLSEGE